MAIAGGGGIPPLRFDLVARPDSLRRREDLPPHGSYWLQGRPVRPFVSVTRITSCASLRLHVHPAPRPLGSVTAEWHSRYPTGGQGAPALGVPGRIGDHDVSFAALDGEGDGPSQSEPGDRRRARLDSPRGG
jgi:hypothetical protein